MTPGCWHLLFFRGHGWIPVLTRLLTWEWWRGQKWRDVPAHVAIFWDNGPSGWIEIEAIATGIRRGELTVLPGSDDGVCAQINLSDGGPDALLYASQQVGRRYGFETAALTGLAAIPAANEYAQTLWSQLASGRTVPLHCSLLAAGALKAAGYELPKWETPPSPNQVYRYLLGNQVKTNDGSAD